MHTLRMFMPIAIALLGTLTYGCSEKPAAAPTETTAATTGADATRNEIAQLQRERNEARTSLAEERSAREQERQRYADDTAKRREYDNLEMRVLQSLEKADQDIQTLQTKAARAAMKQRSTRAMQNSSATHGRTSI